MKITLLAVGTRMPRWVDEAYADYAKRLPREVQLELKEIRPEKRGSGVTAEKGIAAEHARLMAALRRATPRDRRCCGSSSRPSVSSLTVRARSVAWWTPGVVR